jgi:uncharacterized protein
MLHETPGPPDPGRATASGGSFLVVCFDDLAPHSQRACQEFLPQLARAGVARVSLLLVPRWHGVESILDRPYFARWVRALAEAGHEVCLHGHTHSGIDGELHRLGRAETEASLAQGAALCARAGIAVSGFVPPCGRLSTEARGALAARGFAYTATAAGIDLLASGRHLPAPVVPLAAAASWQVPGAWLKTRLLYSARRSAPVLRLVVQPPALYQPALRQTLLSLVREALATRTALTCGELAARAAAC